MLSKSKRYIVSGESVNASHKFIILKQIILAFIGKYSYIIFVEIK